MDVAGSGGSAITSTLTTGIQDISALLPLLGTEQCEEHLASSLTNGYLYAAATPLSIFGSLGAARAGFKTLLSSISIPRLKFAGAKVLADAGFKPQGMNLSLVMLNEDRKGYCAEDRLESMMKELHLDDSNKISLSSKTGRWNILMILVTAVCSLVSITPYIHLNLHEPNSLTPFVRWTFPIIRAIGGFLTATMTQLVIQSRILEITRKRLILNGLSETEQKVFHIDLKDQKLRSTALDEHFSVLEREVRLTLNSLVQTSTQNSITSSDAVPMSPTHNPTTDRVQTDHPDPKISPPSSPITHVTADVRDHEHLVAIPPRISSSEVVDLEKGIEPKAGLAPPVSIHNASVEDIQRLELICDRIIEAKGNSVLRWIFLIFLFIGIVASVAGYIGCFSTVQGVRSSSEALYWLCLEAGLSIIRIILWGLNPKGDDAPPLEIKLKLDEHSPLPTCTSRAEDIEHESALPLVRATEFLETITSYTGLVKQFSDPTLTLYYTLTCRYKDNDPKLILCEHVLYITVFHHTERTTRVYTGKSRTGRVVQDDEKWFYSADPVTVDLEHGILMTKIGHPIEHKADPIAGDVMVQKALQEHYHSILDQIDLKFGTGCRPEHDTLKNDWTLKLGDANSEMQNLGEAVNTDQKEEEQLEGYDRTHDHQYLEQGRLDRNVQYLFDTRGKWITDYMDWLHRETDSDLREAKEVHGIEMEQNERDMMEWMLITERMQMEMMFVHEIYGWEEKLRKSYENFVNSLVSKYGLDAVPHALEGRWRTRSWERLEKGRLAMEARVDAAETKLLQWATDAEEDISRRKAMHSECNSDIRRIWERLVASTLTASSPAPSPRIRLDERLENETSFHVDSWGWDRNYRAMKEDGRKRCDQKIQEMKSRLRREVEGVEERLERGFERCREFWSSQELVEMTHSNSKWTRFIPWQGEFDAMVHALESRQNVIHITIPFSHEDDEVARIFAATRKMMSCTSISCPGENINIPDSVQLPPNILSISDVILSKAQKDTLKQNQLQSQRTTIEFDGGLWRGRVLFDVHSFTLRFFGPPSDYLTLRLIHRSSVPENYFTVNEGKYPIPHSKTLVVEEFKIWNSTLPTSSELTFMPESRNTLEFHVNDEDNYTLRDIELLDNDRLPYQPPNGRNEGEYPRPLPPGESSLHIEEVALEVGQDKSDTTGRSE